MNAAVASILERLTLPVRLDYLSVPQAAAIYITLGAAILWTGVRSLRWLDPARKWTAIGVRLAVLWVIVLLLAGARWVRVGHDVEVIVLRDVSASTASAPAPPGRTVQAAIDDYVRAAARAKPARDRLGLIGFDADATVDALPTDAPAPLSSAGRAIRRPADGTDIAAAIRLGLASFDPGVRRRLLLVSDGNATQGDTDAALATAASLRIPVDVLPLGYDIRRDAVLESLHAPVWVRRGEPYTIDATVRWTGALAIAGRLSVTRQSLPLDLDPATPGVQPSLRVTVKPGLNVVHVTVPPSDDDGANQFHAEFSPSDPSDDALPANNSADAFTFVRGKERALYVDNLPNSQGNHLLAALRAQGTDIPDAAHITPDQFPTRLIDLESYQAVILANVPRGPGELTEDQDRLLTRYVRDLGGGLLVIGGPEALGAGAWQGSELEKILPVELEPPTQRTLPAGALVLVIDRSGSMDQPMAGGGPMDKQRAAAQSAVLSLRTLLPGDQVGVVAFNGAAEWIVPLTPNHAAADVERRILSITSAGGTNIFPGLELAYNALARLPADQAAVRHILLLTDGQSNPGDYDALLDKCRAAKITLSTVAVGPDADTALLSSLAAKGRGSAYVVNTAGQLSQVFIREARTLRRALIHEPPDPIQPLVRPDAADLLKGLNGQPPPPVTGMVLTARRSDPTVEVPLIAPGIQHDPILAFWQTGLGRCAVFTPDASSRWAANWVASPAFGSFWSQLLRSVSRPPMSSDFEVRTLREGNRTRLIVEATGSAGAALNFYTFAGKLAGPDPRQPPADVRLSQVGPGRYEALLDTPDPGAYVAAVQYAGPNRTAGTLLAGVAVPASAEFRDLHSNDSLLSQIATRTGGRMHPPLAGPGGPPVDLFAREGLPQAISSQPIQNVLVALLLPMCLLDVAVRRIAWDRDSLHKLASAAAQRIREFTLTSHHPSATAGATLAALRRSRPSTPPNDTPSPTARFEPHTGGIEGDTTHLTGGATATPAPKRCPTPSPTGTSNPLLQAKRRAQQHFRSKDQDETR